VLAVRALLLMSFRHSGEGRNLGSLLLREAEGKEIPAFAGMTGCFF
jgi:hypothetical protein